METLKLTLKASGQALVMAPYVAGNNAWFNADAVIDAYQTGKKYFTSEFMKMIKSQLSTTIQAGRQLKTTRFEALQVHFLKSYVRIEGVSSFNLLVLVDKASFLSDGFRDVYVAAQAIENRIEEQEQIFLTFSFIPFTDQLNEAAIESNGFNAVAA
jgi:hypothetical protein